MSDEHEEASVIRRFGFASAEVQSIESACLMQIDVGGGLIHRFVVSDAQLEAIGKACLERAKDLRNRSGPRRKPS